MTPFEKKIKEFIKKALREQREEIQNNYQPFDQKERELFRNYMKNLEPETKGEK